MNRTLAILCMVAVAASLMLRFSKPSDAAVPENGDTIDPSEQMESQNDSRGPPRKSSRRFRNSSQNVIYHPALESAHFRDIVVGEDGQWLPSPGRGETRERARELDIAAGRNVDVREREDRLRELSSQLRRNFTREAVMGLLGEPSCLKAFVHEPGLISEEEFKFTELSRLNGEVAFVYSPHPKRSFALAGDSFQVLTVWFDQSGRLQLWGWANPAMD